MKNRVGQVWENDIGTIVLVLGPHPCNPKAHEVVVIHNPHLQCGSMHMHVRTSWDEAVLETVEAMETDRAQSRWPRMPRRLS